MGGSPGSANYIKGIWTFGQAKGWFSWQLFSTPTGECRFIGKWGELNANGTINPAVKGSWTGKHPQGGGGGGGGGGIGPIVIGIPD